MIPRNRDYILEVKKGIHTLDEARNIADEAVKRAEKIKDNYFLERKNPTINNEVSSLLDDVMIKILKKKFTKELMK